MSLHLQKFIDRIQSTESRGLKDVSISLTDAKAMQADLTRLLLELNELKIKQANNELEQVIEVQIGGGKF